jgi:hypothetical protein
MPLSLHHVRLYSRSVLKETAAVSISLKAQTPQSVSTAQVRPTSSIQKNELPFKNKPLIPLKSPK